ncbi:cytochrome b/b6 domain-containing protein, partial [Microbacterium sp. zg.Y909]|nr:cytochrome b/b6 domain-containing protein [Microbacterium sp. zg.Y909]
MSAPTEAAPASAEAPAAPAETVAPASVPAASATVPAAAAASTAPAAAASTAVATGPRPPLTVPRTVWPGAAASRRPAPKPEPRRIGPFTRGQWAGVVIVGGGALLVAAAMAVFFVRWFLSLEFMQEFLATYPGEYHLPEGAPIGFPAWLGWQHFFNAFLMVLIIRTGLQVRTEKRPTVFWTPRRDKKG